MEIKLSRHSKNNIRLYEINLSEIKECTTNPDKSDREGKYLIAYKVFSERFSGLPLKVVYVIEKGNYFRVSEFQSVPSFRKDSNVLVDLESLRKQGYLVISAYPLKKSYWG